MYDRLSAQDRSFLDLEGPTSHMHVGGVFLFEMGPLARPEGGLDIDQIHAYVESKLHRIPRYRQCIRRIPLEEHPVWVDDEHFNLRYHVRHTCLPAPGDERQLKRLCARVMSQQLDRGKPLWELWFVEGLEHDRVAMLCKTHHCMIDGISGMDLLQVLLRTTPDKTFEQGPGWFPNAPPSGSRLLRDALARRAWMPVRFARAAARELQRPAELRAQLAEIGAGLRQTLASMRPADETPFNRPIGPHRRFDWLAFDLDEVKRVRRELGGTLNDVVLTTVAGAVGRFFTQRGIGASKQARLDFRAFCPVSTRSKAERGALGNRVSAMIAPLPIAEKDPRRRLATVSRTMSERKDSKQVLGAEILASLSEWTTPALFARVTGKSFLQRSSNLVVTNVPGPQVPLYLMGARMTDAYPLVPLFNNQGLGIALFSYAGGLYWGFNADWDLFPDLHEFVVAIDASFRELSEARLD